MTTVRLANNNKRKDETMKLQFRVTAKNGTKTEAVIEGREGGIDATSLTVGEVVEKVQETEAFLEKLTGKRWHIEQVA